jgi:hypothetical protein
MSHSLGTYLISKLVSDFEQHAAHTTEEWASVLTFADMWEFGSIRKLAIGQLGQLGSSVDRIVYGKKFGVSKWLEGAYMDVCERNLPLTEEEGERLGIRDVVKIAATREKLFKSTKDFGLSDKSQIVRDEFQLEADHGSEEEKPSTEENQPTDQEKSDSDLEESEKVCGGVACLVCG